LESEKYSLPLVLTNGKKLKSFGFSPNYASGFGLKPSYCCSLFRWLKPTAMKFYLSVSDNHQFKQLLRKSFASSRLCEKWFIKPSKQKKSRHYGGTFS
jgi:hypothetical protein